MFRENLHFKLYSAFRKFEYKTYSENIIEAGLEVGLTLWEGDVRGDYPFLGYFNVTPIMGAAIELVKVTSDVVLIEEYPKYIYVYLGGTLEYSLTESIGINVFFREYYAVNGSEEQLGNWRYDFGAGVRFYIFRR